MKTDNVECGQSAPLIEIEHSNPDISVAFVTNICPHYRVRTYEVLASYCKVRFYFFSAGDEWYWQQKHGTRTGNFEYEYLSGVGIVGTRITVSLFSRLLIQPCDIFIKCINGRFALPVTYLIARIRRKPFILWTGIWMKLNTRFHRLFFPIVRHIYRNADAVVTYGEHVKQFLVSQGVKKEKIFVAPHAVDNFHYSPAVAEEKIQALRNKLGLKKGQRVVLYLGRIEEVKGLNYLVDAFSEITSSDSILVLAGEGSEKSKIIQQARDIGIAERVRFVDYVSPDDTLSYYALAYVFVLPSITTKMGKELWGLVVNEAMNQGCPVIATEAVGAAAGGLVKNRINGLVVSERNSKQLANALQLILDNPCLREDMSKQARNIISTWDNEQMVLGFRRAINFVNMSKRQSS